MKIGETGSLNDLLLVGKRDAFHSPCVLAKTEDLLLWGGCKVKFVDKEKTLVVAASILDYEGVIDPFINGVIDKAFWVMLRPGMVENLVHHFDIVDTKHIQLRDMTEEEQDTMWDDSDNCVGCYD